MKNASELRKNLSAMDYDPGYFCKFIKDQYVRNRIKKEKFKSILDIGCDTGYMAGLLNYDNYDFEYLGIDTQNNINNNYLVNHHHDFQKVDDTIKFLKQAKNTLMSFDCILMLDVIEHFKNKKEGMEALQLAFNLLDGGGFLFLSTPNCINGKINWPEYHTYEYSLKEILNFEGDYSAMIRRQLFGWSMSDEVYHLNYGMYNEIVPIEISRVLKAIDNPKNSRDIMIVWQKKNKQ